MEEKTDALNPLVTLYDAEQGQALSLPAELSALYGPLRIPLHPGRTYTFANFVTTLDGVVSLDAPGRSGGGEISGHSKHDRLVMGLLRSIADAVVVGAGTLRSVPQHLWTAEYIFPPQEAAYRSLRHILGKSPEPLNVIVTARGSLDLGLPVFQSEQIPALIVTTMQGAAQIRQPLPPSVRLDAVQETGHVTARSVLDAITRAFGGHADMVLVEGGPHLIGDFYAEALLNELFLTLAPQVAGRSKGDERPGLVEGKLFAPQHPIWGRLISTKRAENHLFLRYAF
ncbi:MAG: dihydrofolate reductase family protein [Chloroflexi bacterium]|nr:dihydrofolate reductase family protein [Chloroflexota bacterium]